VRKRLPEDIEIPITPMLDMAFQLLTFFILTYRPAPTEVQFNMNLLPPAPAARMSAEPPPTDAAAPSDAPAALRTLTTTLRAGEGGGLASITLGENEVGADLDQLSAQLEQILHDPNLGFDQALLQVDPHLSYAALVGVIDVFAKRGLTKVSFTELPPGL
jgi:biopolymer transport protein ExbD